MTRKEWDAYAKKYPGKRLVTLVDGRIVEWPWKVEEVPRRARLWTIIGAGLPWMKFDQETMNELLGREWREDTFRKKRGRNRGNSKADMDPKKL